MIDTQKSTPVNELEAAEAAYKDLGIRIASGDTKVTADQIAEAAKQVEFLKARETFAAEAEARARAERDQAAADEARKRLARISTAKVDKARASAEKALKDYVASVHEYHAAFNEAVDGAQGLSKHFKGEFGVLTDLADGTHHKGDLNPRAEIEEIVTAAWNEYCQNFKRPLPFPFDTDVSSYSPR